MLRTTAFRVIGLACAALLGLAALSIPAQAQERPRVSVGERIRWSITDAPAGQWPFSMGREPVWIAGTLIARTADTLVVEVLPGAAPARVPINSIRRLDARRQSARRVVVPALMGAGAVAAFGYFVAWEPNDHHRTYAWEVAGMGAITGAMAGASYGLVDMFVNPWERVRLPTRARVTSGGDGRIALSATLPF